MGNADECVDVVLDVENRLCAIDLVNVADVSRQITNVPGTNLNWDHAKKGLEIVERKTDR
jgi:hypothetical protein